MTTPEAERAELLELLRIAEDRRWHHHMALWEEEKHFTWWIALIFPALVFVQTNRDLTAISRLLLTLIGAAFGLFVSLVAIAVFRREGESFVETRLMVNRIVSMLGLDKPSRYQSVDAARQMAISQTYDTATAEPNKPIRVLCFWFIRWLTSRVSRFCEKPPELGVRDWFQVLFIVAMILFLSFAVWSVLTWIGL